MGSLESEGETKRIKLKKGITKEEDSKDNQEIRFEDLKVNTTRLNPKLISKLSQLKVLIDPNFILTKDSNLNIFSQDNQAIHQQKFNELVLMLSEDANSTRTKSLEPKIKNLCKFTKNATMKKYSRVISERYLKNKSKASKSSCNFFIKKEYDIPRSFSNTRVKESNATSQKDNCLIYRNFYKIVKNKFDKEYYKNEIDSLTSKLFGKDGYIKKNKKNQRNNFI